MKKIEIRKTIWGIMLATVTLFSQVACMSDNDVTTTPECAIVNFSVGSITSPYVDKKYDSSGNATDTIVSRTIAGSEIFFNIDQVNGRIYNVDSLPNWVSLKAVVPSFRSYGNVYMLVDEENDLYYTLTSGADSIDFSKKVRLMCVSTDKTSSRFYDVEINKHATNTDTLEWRSVNTDFAVTGKSKALYADGKVFVFAQNEEGEGVVSWAESSNATAWSIPVEVPVDGLSVVLYGDYFYGLGTDGLLYRSAPEELATTWEKASNQKMERLLAADEFRLYAYDGSVIIGSSDLSTWNVEGASDLDMLPEEPIFSASYATSTNSDIQVVVMSGLSNNNTQHAVTWYKASSADNAVNQPWAYIQVTDDNPYGLHHLDALSTTYYKKALFAIGVEQDKYKDLYRSDDNGITWHPQTEMYPVPNGLDPANGVANIVAVDTKLWIIQENGTVWQGSMQ